MRDHSNARISKGARSPSRLTRCSCSVKADGAPCYHSRLRQAQAIPLLIHARSIRTALAEAGEQNVSLVDLKSETNRLYVGYISEAIYLSLAGVVAMFALLLLVLRWPARVLRVIAPLVAAVMVVVALPQLVDTVERLPLVRHVVHCCSWVQLCVVLRQAYRAK